MRALHSPGLSLWLSALSWWWKCRDGWGDCPGSLHDWPVRKMAGSHSLRGNFTLGKEDNGADPTLHQQSSFDWCFMVGKEGNSGQDHWETVTGQCRKPLGEKCCTVRCPCLGGECPTQYVLHLHFLFILRSPHNWHFWFLHLPILAWPGREILA